MWYNRYVNNTEIQVQGLELDYTCLLWDADMRCDNGKWRYYTFNGKTAWNEKLPDTENKQEQIKYMLNAYRVLLTRARAVVFHRVIPIRIRVDFGRIALVYLSSTMELINT